MSECIKVVVIGRLAVSPPARLSLPARRLVALLAIHGGQLSRTAAADSLWPDHPEETGRANLRRALWQAPRRWIAASDDQLTFDADCDLAHARRAAARAIEAAPVTFDEIDLFTADVLPGWHEDWAIAAQEEYRMLRVQALECACRTLLSHGNFPLAIKAGAAAVAAEPLRESASEALIDVHLAQSNRFEAVRCYRALARRLHEDLGVDPMPGLTRKMAEAGLLRAA